MGTANAFESGARKAIPAVLIYARDERGRVLMIHRNSRPPEAVGRSTAVGRNETLRPGDYHAGKWNGLGGKCEADESPREAAKREFHEEAGLDLPEDRFHALGTLTFPNFKAHKDEDWIVFVFTVEIGAGDVSHILKQVDEGDLHWIPSKDLLALNLWPGDKHFIPFVASGTAFLGTIWYQGPEVTRHWVQPLN
jgi:8-oxo-dGTP diphosphatase